MYVQLPLIHILMPLWQLRALIIAATVIVAAAAFAYGIWQLRDRPDPYEAQFPTMPHLSDLDDAPGELTGALAIDEVWALILDDMRGEADIIDRWLAAGCPADATPWALFRSDSSNN